jgi:hypothetical protein
MRIRGLLVALGPRLPHELLLGKGLEAHQYSFVVLGFALIHSYRFGDRTQVTEFVQDRIKALRNQNPDTGLYKTSLAFAPIP